MSFSIFELFPNIKRLILCLIVAMHESVSSTDRGNPSSPRVGLFTARTKKQLIPLNSHRWRPTSNWWLMEFRCTTPTSVSFSLMNNQPETPQRSKEQGG